MKDNKGMGHIKTIILTIIIISCAIAGVYYVKLQYSMAKIKTIKTNMSLVQFKASEHLNKQKAEGKEEISYIGTKISEIMENEDIKHMIENGTITEEECEKYYLLTDEELKELGTNVNNEENSYYLINYETGEVIITAGCEMENNKLLYKLSEIEAEEDKKEEQSEKNEEKEEEQPEQQEQSEQQEEQEEQDE